MFGLLGSGFTFGILGCYCCFLVCCFDCGLLFGFVVLFKGVAAIVVCGLFCLVVDGCYLVV